MTRPIKIYTLKLLSKVYEINPFFYVYVLFIFSPTVYYIECVGLPISYSYSLMCHVSSHEHYFTPTLSLTVSYFHYTSVSFSSLQELFVDETLPNTSHHVQSLKPVLTSLLCSDNTWTSFLCFGNWCVYQPANAWLKTIKTLKNY